MDRARVRSADVGQTIAVALKTTDTAHSRFEDLYRSSRDDVYAYATSLLHDRSAAEDVTALAFERAFRRRRTFNPRRGTERGWLFGIARNAALDELRRRKRLKVLAADPEDLGVQAPEDAVERTVRRAALRDALAELQPRERELVALKFHAGLSNVEIAGVLGISESNAGTMLHRAIAKLRKACHDTP